MKTMYEILKDKKSIRVTEKIENKIYDFYAFVGYHPIVRELMLTKTHAGEAGCFMWMFVEKDKAKAAVVIRNLSGEIESVCFVIYDSFIIGNSASTDASSLGNMGFYTHDKYRGNNNMINGAKFMVKNLSKIIDNFDERVFYIQDYICDKLREEIPEITIEPIMFAENDGSHSCNLKHPYSIDFNTIVENCWCS